MSNCLVTKLKSTVVNDRLLKPGEIYLKANEIGNKFTFSAPANTIVTVYAKKGTVYAAYGTIPVDNPDPATIVNVSAQITIGNAGYFDVYLPDGAEASVVSSYDLNGCSAGGVAPSVYRYMQPLTSSVLFYGGRLSDLPAEKVANVKVLDFGITDFDADILSYISAAASATGVTCPKYSNAITAEQFGAALSTTATMFIGPRNTKFTGTIEGFVAAQRAKGKTEGNLKWFNGAQTGVTFNGENVGNAWDTITWTSSTITFLGVTVNA